MPKNGEFQNIPVSFAFIEMRPSDQSCKQFLLKYVKHETDNVVLILIVFTLHDN